MSRHSDPYDPLPLLDERARSAEIYDYVLHLIARDRREEAARETGVTAPETPPEKPLPEGGPRTLAHKGPKRFE